MQGTILTNIGRSKIASATPESQLNITHVAIGDGNGGYPPISVVNTALINEVYRVDAQSPLRDANNPDVLIFEGSISASAGPFTVREIGLFDIAGDLIAIGQVVATFKPAGSFTILVRVHIKLDNASDVQVVNTQVDLLNSASVSYSGAISGEVNVHQALNKRVRAVKSLSELLAVNTNLIQSGDSFLVKSFLDNDELGGGIYFWDSTKNKNLHDGQAVIDPLKTLPTDWSNVAQRGVWLTPSSSGVGCFVRQYLADDTIESFGYTFDQPTRYAESFGRFVFGEEYLQHITNSLRNHTVNNPEILHSGDSTTAGDGADGFHPATCMNIFATKYGLRCTNINRGKSGHNTVTWNTQFVAEDIAAYPNMSCYIVRWGINDGSSPWGIHEYEQALRGGLAQLRAFKSVASLSIILMSPSTVYDNVNGRDPVWFEQINPVLRQAARDFKCAFFDTYAMFRDSKNGAGIWLDDPYGDGRGIHPKAELNLRIYQQIAQMVYGPIQGTGQENNALINIGGSTAILDIAQPIVNYRRGISLNRVTNGFPYNGFAITYKHTDNILWQQNIEMAAPNRVSYRTYNPFASSWSDWISSASSGSVSDPITLAYATNWTVVSGQNPLKLFRSGKLRVISGSMQWTGGGAVPLTAFATLDVGDRPPGNAEIVGKTQTGITFGFCNFRVSSAGEVRFLGNAGDGIAYIEGSWFVE